MAKKTYAQTNSLPRRSYKPKERIIEIDFLRGIALILMVAVHFCSAASTKGVVQLFLRPNEPNQVLNSMNRFCYAVLNGIIFPAGHKLGGGSMLYLNCLEVFWAGMFIFLSGISCTFSRNNLLRGLQLGIMGECLTIIMIAGCTITNSDGGIIIGILHAISIGIILYAIYDRFFPKLWQTFLAGILLSIFTWMTMSKLFLPSGNQGMANLPKDWWKLLLGTARWGNDYFSPVMVSAAIFLGASWGKLFYKDRKSLWPSSIPSSWTKPICFLGRHTLSIYVLHMPAVYLILGAIYLGAGYRLRTF